MTAWQLADLIGVHEHQVDLDELPDLPVRVLHEIARRLDLHPADILREADDLYALPRTHPPAIKHPSKKPPSLGHDALRLVNALALADRPMLPEEVARALSWTVKRVDNATTHALAHPVTGGAIALRVEPSGYLSVSPRLDLLVASQHTQLTAPHHSDDTGQPGRHQRDPLTPTEAEALLAIWHTGDTDHTNPLQDHALHGLINGGLVAQPGGLTLALTDDALYSLNPGPNARTTLPH
ncbi:hypothetical protein ACIRPK_36110 [Kitasatospora sp. NPDC101801]|uniref:hypothetical protein n=1 Tax=Kitasatospora sp. NPDC101801 TaxID=3364103 RepID=UPI0037FE3A01